MKKIKQIIIFAASAFLLNFLWESIHAVYLYKGISELNNPKFLHLILRVSIEDMLILLVIFAGAVLIWHDISWFKKVNKWKYFYLITTTLSTAIFIEARAIFFENRWSYTDLMPTIFGLGLSPLLQLLTTATLSILVLKQLKN
jgi:hypothetical protein